MGKDFAYSRELSPKHNFDWKSQVIVTDKIDGTTTQADNQNLYKRIDKFKKGDPQKFIAPEEVRYDLHVLSESAPENKWIFLAYTPFKERIAKLPSGIIVYFECFGDRIDTRYKGRPQDIRVFDFAEGDTYLPFETTIHLCEQLSLPIVGHEYAQFSGVEEVIEHLSNAVHIDKNLRDYELEGWVLRQGDQIAKIRKADLNRLLP